MQKKTTNTDNANNANTFIQENNPVKSMPLSEESIAQLLLDNKIGLQSADSSFSPCAISLAPWKLSQSQFTDAVETAQALSSLFRLVSNNTQFLTEALSDFHDASSLIFQLKRGQFNSPERVATNLNVSRQDFLLDTNGHWRLVESNSIAAGMGPFCEALRAIHIQMLGIPATAFPENPATMQLAQQLFESAQEVHQNEQPLIIFVVEAIEDNIYDQIKIADALKQMGARVVRKSFDELSKQLSSNSEQKLFLDGTTVDCFYFRTGYNLADYQQSNGDFATYLSLRFFIEQHQVVVAPAMNMQLATSKWVQMKLSQLSSNNLQTTFGLTESQSTLVSKALALEYQTPKTAKELATFMDSKHWILKTQNEGGGNVTDKAFLQFAEKYPQSQLILMQKIDSMIRQEGSIIFSKNQYNQLDQVISELGILTLGENDRYGGYLLRSKPARQLETGVHQAGGFLDVVIIE